MHKNHHIIKFTDKDEGVESISWNRLFSSEGLREPVKYYFADFVRKGGGGGTPQIRNPLFAEKKIRKGGEGGTPQIRNL